MLISSRGLNIGCLIFCSFWGGSSHSQNPELEAYIKQQKAMQSLYIQDQKQAFRNYKQEFRNGLSAFKQRVNKVWGYADVSTETRLVSYSDDLKQKLIVDFDNNTLRLVQNDDTQPKAVKKLIKKTLLEKISADSEQTIADVLGLKDKPLDELASALQNKQNEIDNKLVIAQNIKQLEKLKSKLSNVHSEQDSEDKQQEKAYLQTIDQELQKTQQFINKPEAAVAKGYQIRLPARRWQRAQPYRRFIRQQAAKYKIQQSLIYSVMEVESSFNPRAQSPIPAFGLMQIVPTTAGIDASVFLRKGKQPPTRRDLFDPENNVLFGSTYLHILFTRYFHTVTDPESRLYCAIAAYNTGMGNVAKIFNGNGSYNVKQAVPKINRLTPEQVFKTIVDKAHPETQAYIQRVSKAQQYFAKQLARSS